MHDKATCSVSLESLAGKTVQAGRTQNRAKTSRNYYDGSPHILSNWIYGFCNGEKYLLNTQVSLNPLNIVKICVESDTLILNFDEIN